jgi:hypothetical protein
VRTLGAEEFAGDVEGFTSHHDNFLAVKEVLGDRARQSAQKVALAVNNDLVSRQSIFIPISSLLGISQRTTGANSDILCVCQP